MPTLPIEVWIIPALSTLKSILPCLTSFTAYDLAVYGGNFDRFALDVNEETSTLLQFDIVDADRKMQPELLESIEKEGVVLYEKI